VARWRGPVLIDTNAIIEAWRIGAWRALCGGYVLETVEECVIETQTGFQNRRPAQEIERQALLAGLKKVHKISDAERAAALIRDGEIAMLDEGEKVTRLPERMPGCCAAPTRRACELAYGRIFAITLCRLNAFSTKLAFARKRRSEAPIVRTG
jgi:hypothetical protein